MQWHEYLPFLVFAVVFISSILSGMTGGGAGFIITPFFIALGLTPQQSIATGKLGGVGVDIGAIIAFRHYATKHKAMASLLAVIALLIGVASGITIRHIGNSHLQLLVGVFSLAMIPTLFIKHHGLKSRRRHSILQAMGLIAIIAAMLLQGVFSSGFGSLINVFLIIFFGSSALEANFIKRRASLVLDVVVFLGLLSSGLINYRYGLIALAAGASGGYLGAKFALHEGERFARYALMVFMLAAGVWLISSA